MKHPFLFLKSYLRHTITLPSGCIEWIGAKNNKGYGRMNYAGEYKLPHRLAYIFFVGKIKKDMQVDHLCRNRACCNPEHLEVVTQSTNLRRGILHNSLKIKCPRGHDYDEKNTYIDSNNRRHCRVCDRDRRRYT